MTQIIYSLCWYLGGYGIPAIPTRPSCLSSHGSHKTRRSFWRRRVSHRHIVGGYGILPYPRGQQHPKLMCNPWEECDVGALLAWLVQRRPLHPLRGWRGYGRMPYPPTKTPTDCIATLQQQDCHATTTRLPRYDKTP